MILKIDTALDEETLQDLVQMYNTGDAETQYKIYLRTPGGLNGVTLAMIDLINNHAESTELIAYHQICSNGMQLFFKAKCKKRIVPYTEGMSHLLKQTLDYYEGNVKNKNEYSSFINSNSNLEYSKSLHDVVGYTKDEWKRIKNNEDVWFTYERLQEMLTYNLTKL